MDAWDARRDKNRNYVVQRIGTGSTHTKSEESGKLRLGMMIPVKKWE